MLVSAGQLLSSGLSAVKCVLGLAHFEEGGSCCMCFRRKCSLANCKRAADGFVVVGDAVKSRNCVSWWCPEEGIAKLC